MGTFSASLRTVGDVTALPATIEISEGRLTISAGSSEIGSWSLDEVSLQEIPTGYRMIAEGDQILIELKDVTSFSAALATGAKKKRRLTLKSGEKMSTAPTGETPVVAPPPAAKSDRVKPPAGATAAAEMAPAAPRQKRSRTKGASGVFDFVDTLLINARKRFGAYLPDFMFSRAMFFIALGVIATMVLLPGVFSTVLLIAGALLVLFGAIVYTDSVLASRFLPGRSTPQQVLVMGVSVLLLGVLLGAIAR
jgi:hypothetical protein